MKQNKNPKHVPYYISTGYPSGKSYLPDAFPYHFMVLLISETTPRGKTKHYTIYSHAVVFKLDNIQGNRSWTKVSVNITITGAGNQNWIKLK